MSFSALKKQFKYIQKTQENLQLDQVDTPFTLQNFDTDHALKQWIDNPNTTLILLGRCGLGKTQFWRALVKSKGLKALFVNHKQDFRQLNALYDSII